MNDFPEWIRVSHWINVLFLGFLIRAGIQILGAHPFLYWNDHCTPGTHWLKLTRKQIPKDRLWSSLELEEDVPVWLGQPGGKNLGLGRHWHFFGAIFWMLNGVFYFAYLIATDEWRRLVPTSWAIVPDAFHTFITYATFDKPPPEAFHPFDPLQQLVYFAVVFLLAPFLILTGLAQSPAISARFPWFLRLLGGRQAARSLHFLGLIAFVAFTAMHTALVAYTGLGDNLAKIGIGGGSEDAAFLSVAATISVILGIYALTTWWSRIRPRSVQATTGAFFRPLLMGLSFAVKSKQHYSPREISPFFIVNGYPPATNEYSDLFNADFRDWRLEVRGLVQRPLSLSLDDLKSLRTERQITMHHCIQGWTGIAEWGGVRVSDVLSIAGPTEDARYLVFWSYQMDDSGRPFYETLDIRLADHRQTILAFEMNSAPLDEAHGAPLRLRVETQLGFKMVKWVRSIEVVADYRDIRDGQGGSREDLMYYEQSVGI